MITRGLSGSTVVRAFADVRLAAVCFFLAVVATFITASSSVGQPPPAGCPPGSDPVGLDQCTCNDCEEGYSETWELFFIVYGEACCRVQGTGFTSCLYKYEWNENQINCP